MTTRLHLARAVVGLNLLFLEPGRLGGTGTYARELLSQYALIAPHCDFVLFLNRDSYNEFHLPEPHFRKVLAPVAAGSPLRRHLVEQFLLPSLARRHGVDILHSMGYVCPLLTPIPQIITVHDMLYKRHPEHLPRNKRLFWQFFVPRSVRRAKKVIAVSESARQDILTFLSPPPDKVQLIHSGVGLTKRPAPDEIEATRLRYGISGDYILAVGCGRHKRVDLIVEALRNLPTLQLVVTGVPESGNIPTDAPDNVRYVGFVDRQDLLALYAGARAYVTASEMEGFGLTVLEAMMVDTPVVSSDAGSLPEICGDAASIVPGANPEKYADAIASVCFDQSVRNSLIDRGKKRAAAFSWRASAQKHLQLYLQVARATVASRDALPAPATQP